MQNKETSVVFNSVELTPAALRQCVEDSCKLNSFHYMYIKSICNPNYRSNLSAVRVVLTGPDYLEELIYQVTTDIKFAENMNKE